MDRRIDREWDNSRLTIRTGAYSRDVHDGLSTMLDHLRRTGNSGLWQGLVERKLSPLDLYDSYLRDELNSVVLVESVQPAKSAVLEWVDAAEIAETTKKSYRQYTNDLFRDYPGAKIQDIPEAVERVRIRCKERGQKTSYIQAKKVAFSYASHNFGKDSPLWNKISKVQRIRESSHVHHGKARSVSDVVAAVKKMGKPYGPYFWTMCLLGAGTKEYLEDGFTVEDSWVTVHGQKYANRDRRVPLIFSDLKPPPSDRRSLDRALQRVQENWVLYDARRTFSHWAEMAGVPSSGLNRTWATSRRI